MKFFVDENTSPRIVTTLEQIFMTHEFVTPEALDLTGASDVEVFERLGHYRFDAIITKDKNQLDNPHELQSLYENGIHWLGYKDIKGLGGVPLMATVTATLSGGLVPVLKHWSDRPRCYKLMHGGREPGQRFKAFDVDTQHWRTRGIKL
jgi:predicted nuclease of predicted toxin-antitoxin system